MSHTVVFKLNKPANEFAAGESTGFGLRGGVQYYDRKTKQKEWTNYSCAVFAKNPNQIDFYRNALVEGAVVEVGAKQLMTEDYNGNISIGMLDAWIGSINQSAPRASQQGGQQQAPQQSQQQQAPQHQTTQRQEVQQQPGGNPEAHWEDVPF
jgi:single-strand DNA-binding protein